MKNECELYSRALFCIRLEFYDNIEEQDALHGVARMSNCIPVVPFKVEKTNMTAIIVSVSFV